MNLRDLRYLVAAADTEHFGQAAERCHVSQPTLSGQIRKLEETLGIALFERSHRSVALTEAGREITGHARDILERVRRMEELALSRRDTLVGPLRIGIIPTLCAYLLPALAVAGLRVPGVVCRPLSVAGGTRRIALLRRRSSSRLPAIEAFGEAVLECLPASVPHAARARAGTFRLV